MLRIDEGFYTALVNRREHMKILIEIPEELYESAKNESYTSIDEYDAIKAIANGRLIDADDKEIL